VFLEGLRGGVIYLRILPATLDATHRELARVLDEHTESELESAFVVGSQDGTDLEGYR
jgi:hypothetical protein